MGRGHLGLNVSSLSVQLADPFSFCPKCPEAATVRRLFDEFGLVVLRDFFLPPDLRQIKGYIHQLIKVRSWSQGMNTADYEVQFDDGLRELAIGKEQELAFLQSACRHLLPVHQLAESDRLVSISKFLLKTPYIMSHPEKQVQIAAPGNHRPFDWRQDPFTPQATCASLVYWAPLHDVHFENGALVVAPGSHRLGKLPTQAQSFGARSTELLDYSVLSQFPHVPIVMNEGDLLVFSSQLLHRSGENQSDRARWSLEIRHGNLNQFEEIVPAWSDTFNSEFGPIANRRRPSKRRPSRPKPPVAPTLSF